MSVEWLDSGGADLPPPRPRRGRPPRWAVIGVVSAAVVAIVVAIVRSDGGSGHPRAAVTQPPTPKPIGRTLRPRPLPPPRVTRTGYRILGVHGDWELFGRGLGVVVRIQLARGRITRTTIPALDSGGPVSFLATGDAAIVRPLDYVAGYVVPDGHRARRTAGALDHGGPALPGPRPGTIWVPRDGRNEVVLVDERGRPVSPSTTIRIPRAGFPEADGAGYLLLRTRRGFYDARPDGRTLIGRGLGIIAGPTRWVLMKCRGSRCTMTVIDRRTGARHVSPGGPTGGGITGSISPDGAYVAEVVDGGQVVLIDLRSGRSTGLKLTVDSRQPVGPASQLAWSPDSRWLFVLQGGGMFAVSASGKTVRTLGVRLPYLFQIAIRPAASSRG